MHFAPETIKFFGCRCFARAPSLSAVVPDLIKCVGRSCPLAKVRLTGPDRGCIGEDARLRSEAARALRCLCCLRSESASAASRPCARTRARARSGASPRTPRQRRQRTNSPRPTPVTRVVASSANASARPATSRKRTSTDGRKACLLRKREPSARRHAEALEPRLGKRHGLISSLGPHSLSGFADREG